MKCVRIYYTSINDKFIQDAVDTLRAGEIIIYPTDTLYAMACDALNTPAIDKLCRAKGINPQKDTLSIVCSDISQASEYAKIDNGAFRLLKSNLPGPFTFILPAAASLPKAFKGRRTVGVRVPKNPVSTTLARELGTPLLTTSLPVPDGEDYESLSHPDTVAMLFEDKAALMIDGGDCGVEPSTVVDATDSLNPVIVRQGAGNLEY